MSNSNRLRQVAAFAVIALFTPALALAHPGHDAPTLAAGLAHPFTGADHMLAMLAVGLWAALRGGRAVWAWPLAFVVAMLGGFAVGQSGLAIPLVEPAILASVIVLGALVAADAKAPTSVGIGLIALFGLAHGYAHGAETVRGGGLGFPIGFALSTAALHLAGLGLGSGLKALNGSTPARLLGLGAMAGGLVLAFTG